MRRYRKMRARMLELDVDGKWLARQLGLCQQSLSNRMTLRTPWSVDEAYKVLELLRVPAEELHIYFPPNGVSQN